MKTNKSAKSKKYPKLDRRGRELASQFIEEERLAGKPQKIAVPVGLSRARAARKREKIHDIVDKYL